MITSTATTCPECWVKTKEEMPTDSCQFFWECPACGEVLKPKKGVCCVFCSYGDVPCPLIRRINRVADGSYSPMK